MLGFSLTLLKLNLTMPFTRKLLIIFFILSTDLSVIGENSIEKTVYKLLNIPSHVWKKLFYLEPEVTMSLPEILNYLGYPLEIHELTTADGYYLTNHRIPHGRNGTSADPNKLPVLLIHSSFFDSFGWVYNGIENSPGLILADAGFDVWMINIRGNTYSRKHKILNPNQAQYWDFSIDDVSYYDMAAFIDYVIKKTGKKQVYIVGQSLGGGLPFLLLAQRPEYNAKVREIYALSPIGNCAGLRGLQSLAAKIAPPILMLLKKIGFHELVVPRWIPKWFIGFYVKYSDFAFKTQMFLLLGPSPDSWNATRGPIFAAHTNGGIAVNFLLHYAQIANTHELRHFDWGKKKNIVRYNQSTPPAYDLKKVTVPVRLYYATNDAVIRKPNMGFLEKNLANAVSLTVAGHGWNHVAYFMGSDAGVFYNELVATMVKDNE